MIRTQKERLEREKMQVLLQYGEEEMQLQFNKYIDTEDNDNENKKD